MLLHRRVTIMALIKCPECGKEISDSVKICPHCGYSIRKHIRVKNREKDVNANEKKYKNIKMIALAVGIVIFIFVLIVIIPKHQWIEADCINPETCSECGKTRGNALGHDFLDATCTEPQICVRCGEKQGKALGHNYGEYIVSKEATCSAYGEKTATCSVCGYVNTEKIPKLAHTAGEWVVVEEPTFANDGKRVRYCTVCKEEIETEIVSLPDDEKESLYKQACKTFSYADYARDPSAVKGDYCKSYGEVSQVFVSDDGKTFDIRINITKTGNERIVIWTDDIWVEYTKKDGAPNILEGDLITFYGVANGTCSYETVSGTTRTVPLVSASYIDIGEDNTKTQQAVTQPTVSQQTTTSNTNNSSGFAFSSNVFCQEEQGIYVEFVGVDDPAGSLMKNYIGVKFLITNNNSSKVTLLLKGFTINDCSFETSGGAAEIAAGAKSFLTCKVNKDYLADYGITSIDKISGYIWVSDIGNTNTFTINTK